MALNTFVYGEERSNIINQIRISNNPNATSAEFDDDNRDKNVEQDLQELWIVRDDKNGQQWIFTCRTLYDLKLSSKQKNKEVERHLNISYTDLWKYFGVDVESCDRTDIKMFMSMFLDCMQLEMPTMNMQRHKDEDSDMEEEIHIKLNPIETICHARHIVDIEGVKLPITMSLIGCGDRYFGVKAVTYNRDTLKEEGLFLRVETIEWLLDQAKIDELPKHRKKDKLKYFYSLPKLMEDQGFECIFNKLKFSQEKVPLIETPLGDLTDVDAFCERFYTNSE